MLPPILVVTVCKQCYCLSVQFESSINMDRRSLSLKLIRGCESQPELSLKYLLSVTTKICTKKVTINNTNRTRP